MKTRHWTYVLIIFPVVVSAGLLAYQKIYNYNLKSPRKLEEIFTTNSNYKIGDKIDSLNGVYVHYNGLVSHIKERNLAADGYNLGLKYQCVEFIKRYYYYHLNHKMPESYGNAKDFYNSNLKDGSYNSDRDLIQFSNPSTTQPEVDDIIIFDATAGNKFGHIAIISKVTENEIEIIQQNPGPYSSSRVRYSLKSKNGLWEIKKGNVLGRLRKK